MAILAVSWAIFVQKIAYFNVYYSMILKTANWKSFDKCQIYHFVIFGNFGGFMGDFGNFWTKKLHIFTFLIVHDPENR